MLTTCFVVGCGSLHADYVEKDRATYDAMKPFVERGIEATKDPTEKKAGKLLHRSWEGRLKAAEEKIKK